MKKIKTMTIFIAIILVGIVYICAFLFFSQFKKSANVLADEATIQINGVNLNVEIAQNFYQKVRGLSGRPQIDDNEGLLFVYDTPGTYGFWMKDMNFPIDILWIDQNYKVVDITHNASLDTYPKTFYPKTPVQFVLEVNANFSKKHLVSEGTTINGIKKIQRQP